MLFASVGYQVSIYDVIPENVDTALVDIDRQLKALEAEGLLRGTLPASAQFAAISKSASLQDCLSGAVHCQVSFSFCLFQFLSVSVFVSFCLFQFLSDIF